MELKVPDNDEICLVESVCVKMPLMGIKVWLRRSKAKNYLMNTLAYKVCLMECIVTENMVKRWESKCYECGKKLKVGEKVEKRKSRFGTHYFCQECCKKWGRVKTHSYK